VNRPDPDRGAKAASARRWRSLFGAAQPPIIPFSYADLPQQVRDAAIGRMSLSGVQIKASIVLNREKGIVEIARGGGTHILKPSPAEYPGLAEIENLCMDMAEALGMQVPPHGLLPMADGAMAYVVKRFDRLPDGSKIHKEDMAQLLSLPTTAKYEASLEKVGKALRRYSSRPFLDLADFFERVVFSFIIGNGDMHLKNWAILTSREDKKPFIRLAPCYDFVASRLYIHNEDETALTLRGRRNRLTRTDFESLASALQIDPRAAGKMINRLIDAKERLLDLVNAAGFPQERRQAFGDLISARTERLRRGAAAEATPPEVPEQPGGRRREVGQPMTAAWAPLRETTLWIEEARAEASRAMEAHMPRKGFMEFTSRIPESGLDVSLFDLKEAAEKSQISTFGWPIGIVLSTEQDRPYSYADGIRAIVRTTREEGPTFDYWDLRRNGDYYLLKSLFEDLRSQGKLFLDTRIIRVAETLLHTARLYRALGAPASVFVRMQFTHGGLKDRELAAAGTAFMPSLSAHRSRAVDIRTALEERLDRIEPQIHELVYRVVSDLTALFDFFKPSRTALVDPLVDRFVQGRI
jgi:serine/threonine-protein kinase HipA